GELRMRGGTAYTLRLARNLPEHGFRVRTISENLQFLSRDYVRRFSMSEVTHLSTPILNRVVLKLLLAELRQNPPAVIHVQSRQMLPPGVRLARELGVPLVLTVHDYLGDRETLRVPQPLVRQIIAVSDSVRNDLLE